MIKLRLWVVKSCPRKWWSRSPDSKMPLTTRLPSLHPLNHGQGWSQAFSKPITGVLWFSVHFPVSPNPQWRELWSFTGNTEHMTGREIFLFFAGKVQCSTDMSVFVPLTHGVTRQQLIWDITWQKWSWSSSGKKGYEECTKTFQKWNLMREKF